MTINVKMVLGVDTTDFQRKIRDADSILKILGSEGVKSVNSLTNELKATAAGLSAVVASADEVKLAFSHLNTQKVEDTRTKIKELTDAFNMIAKAAQQDMNTVGRSVEDAKENVARAAAALVTGLGQIENKFARLPAAAVILQAAFDKLNLKSAANVAKELSELEKAFHIVKAAAQNGAATAADVSRAYERWRSKAEALRGELIVVSNALRLAGVRPDAAILTEIGRIKEALRELGPITATSTAESARAFNSLQSKLAGLKGELVVVSNALKLSGVRPDAVIVAEIKRIEAALRELGPTTTTSIGEAARAGAALQNRLAELRRELSNVSAAFSILKIRPLAEINADVKRFQDAFATLRANVVNDSNTIARAYQALQIKLTALGAEARGAGNAMSTAHGGSSIIGRIYTLIAAYTSLHDIYRGIKNIIKTGLSFETTMQSLSFATGSAHQAGKEYQWLQGVATELGLSIGGLSASFGKFSAATKGTVLEGEKTRDIFKAVAEVGAVLHIKTKDLDYAYKALWQMMSKGKVYSEELQGQFGEHIPGAFAAAARSMGMTTAELVAMLKAGELLPEDFIIKFAAELHKMAAPSLPGILGKLNSQLNLLGNTYTDFSDEVAKAGLFDYLAWELKAFQEEVVRAKENGEFKAWARTLSDAITNIVFIIKGAIIFVKEFSGEISFLAKTLLVSWGSGKAILAFRELQIAIRGAQVEAGLLALSIKAIPLVGTFFAGYSFGTLINDFIKANDNLKEMVSTTSMLKGMLDKVGDVKLSKLFAGAAKQTEVETKKISESLNAEINKIKQSLTNAQNAYGSAWKNRVIAHKEAVAEIAQQEDASKEKSEKIKNEIIQKGKQLTAEITQQLELRYQEIKRVTNEISTLENSALTKRSNEEIKANRTVLDAATKTGNDLIQNTKALTSAVVRSKKDEYQTLEKAQKAYYGITRSIFSDEAGAYKSHYQSLTSAVKQGVDKIIAIKQGMVDALKGKLKEYENEMERHTKTIKGIQEDLAGRIKSLEDVRFDIKLSGMGEVEKFNALISKGAELVTEMGKARAEAAAKGGQADESTIDKFKKLEKDAISLAREISSIGKDMGGAQQAERLLNAIKVQMEAMAQTQIIKEQTGMDALRIKSQDTKLAIDSLLKSIGKFKDFEKINLKFNSSGLDNIDTVLSKFRELVDKDDSNINFGSNLGDINKLLSEVVKPKDTNIKVILNDKEARDAIKALKQPTSSTHTVKVEYAPVKHAAGGLVGAFAEGGSIHGPGTGTSDSIPAMLSNGEFVLRADAVKKWGVDFLYGMNNGKIPKYASGGFIGNSSSSVDFGVVNRLDGVVNNWASKLTTILQKMSPTANNLGAFVKIFETLVELLTSLQSLKEKDNEVKAPPGLSATMIFPGSGGSGGGGSEVSQELKNVNNEIAEAQKKLGDLTSEFEVWRKKTQDIKNEMKGVGTPIKDITEEIKKIGQAPKLDMEQSLEETNQAIEAMYASLETPAVLTVKPDAANADSEVKSLQQPISNTLTVIPNTTGVESKINSLKQPTSSTHTVYVNTVPLKHMGGLVSAFADGGVVGAFRHVMGSIRGPGTGTSDSIPAMLSNGEFVLRADAVNKFGLGFLNALNNGFLPAIPRFSYGGLVSEIATDTGNRIDTVAIELKIGEHRPLKMRSSRQTAMELSSALREIARGS